MTYSHFLFTLFSLVIVLKFSELNFKNLFTSNNDFYSHLIIKNSEYFNLYLKRIFNNNNSFVIPEIFIFFMLSLNSIDFSTNTIYLLPIFVFFLFLVIPYFIIYNKFYLSYFKDSVLKNVSFTKFIETSFYKYKLTNIFNVSIHKKDISLLNNLDLEFNSSEYKRYIEAFHKFTEYLKDKELKPLTESEFIHYISYMNYMLIVKSQSDNFYSIFIDEDELELNTLNFVDFELANYINTYNLVDEKKYNYYYGFVFLLTFKEVILL